MIALTGIDVTSAYNAVIGALVAVVQWLQSNYITLNNVHVSFFELFVGVLVVSIIIDYFIPWSDESEE